MWHGGLLALEALLACGHEVASEELQQLLHSCFAVASDAAMRHLAQRRSPELQAAALRLIPALARARPAEFGAERLEESCRVLADTLKVR